MNFDQKILNKIEKEGLRPLPRWFFALKEFFFLLMVLIGVLASAAAASFVVYFDAKKISLDLVPVSIFWLGLAIVFLFGAKRFLTRVDKLYRLSNFATVPLLVMISVVFGAAFFSHGQTEQAESRLEKIPAYGRLVPEPLTVQDQEREALQKLESERVERQESENAPKTKADDSGDQAESSTQKSGEKEEDENRASALPKVKGVGVVRENKEDDEVEVKSSDKNKTETKIEEKDDESEVDDSADSEETGEAPEEPAASSED